MWNWVEDLIKGWWNHTTKHNNDNYSKSCHQWVHYCEKKWCTCKCILLLCSSLWNLQTFTKKLFVVCLLLTAVKLPILWFWMVDHPFQSWAQHSMFTIFHSQNFNLFLMDGYGWIGEHYLWIPVHAFFWPQVYFQDTT